MNSASNTNITFLICSLLLLSNLCYASSTLTFATVQDAPIQDLSADILKAAYKRLEITVVIKKFPNARALLSSNSGNLDGEVSRIEGLSKNFPNLIKVPVPINRVSVYAYGKTGSPRITSPAELASTTTVCVRGVKIVEALTTKHAIDCFASNSFDQAIKILHLGRVNAAILPHINALASIKKLRANDIQVISPILASKSLFHYLHKKHSAIATLLEEQLKLMLKSGEIAELQKRFSNTYQSR